MIKKTPMRSASAFKMETILFVLSKLITQKVEDVINSNILNFLELNFEL